MVSSKGGTARLGNLAYRGEQDVVILFNRRL